MVYRIRVLSFFHPSLMSDHWLLFQPLTLRRIHFRKVQTSSHSSDESTPDMRQSRKPSFFSVAALTTVKCDLFKTEVHGPQGRERRIKTGAERKHVTGVSAFSLHVFFLSDVHVSSLVFLPSPNIPCSRRQIHINALSGCMAGTCWPGWFKLINVLWDLFVFAGCMNTSHSTSVIGCSHMMKLLVQSAF